MTALEVTPAQNVTDAPNRPHKKPATRLPTTLQYRDGIEDAIGWHSQDRSDSPCVRLVVASLDNLGGGNERMTWEDITKQFKVKR